MTTLPGAPAPTDGILRQRPCRYGAMLYDLRDPTLGALLERYGEVSPDETALLDQLLSPGQTVVEVGANIGVQTLALANFVGPNGRVLAFEPRHRLFRLLCASLALNDLHCVEAHLATAGGRSEGLDEQQRQGDADAEEGPVDDGPDNKVRSRTVDELELVACHLLKIDGELSAVDVIAGARATIERHRPLIYVENDQEERTPELIGLLQEQDYRAYWHLPRHVVVPNFRGNPENGFPHRFSENLLCVPRAFHFDASRLHEVLSPNENWPRSDRLTGAQSLAKYDDAVALFEKGQWAPARELCKQLLKMPPAHSFVLHLAGLIADRTNDPGTSAALLAKAERTKKVNAETYNDRGLVFHERGEQGDVLWLQEALKFFDASIFLDSGYAAPYVNRGHVLLDLGRADEALASYDRAIALRPDFAEAHFGRGNALRRLERLDEALASYDRAIALNPDYSEAVLNRKQAMPANRTPPCRRA